MRSAIAFIICCLANFKGSDSHNVFCKTVDVPDYYWREYRGVIPFDAVPGGIDRAGRTTYIGQAQVQPIGQLPASIYQGNNTVVTSSVKTYYVDKNVKILCSGSPEKFKWIATDIDIIELITNCHLILGGVDYGDQENIGRVNFNDEIVLGKVIRKPLKHEGLFVPYNGTETRFTHYEVLAYDCKPNIDIKTVPLVQNT